MSDFPRLPPHEDPSAGSARAPLSSARRVLAHVSVCLLLVGGRSLAAHAQAPAFRVKDINAQTVGGSSNPRGFVNSGATTFFVTETDIGKAVWVTDGTENGTIRVSPGFTQVGPLTDVDGVLFFPADDSTGGAQLWKTDGTPSGTVPIKPISWLDFNDATRFVAVQGMLFFVTGDAGHGTGFALWKSDGSALGTVPLGHFDYWDSVIPLNGKLFFVAGTPTTGIVLWQSDGTEEGTGPVKDINRGPEYSSPQLLGIAGDAVIFAACVGSTAQTLWRSDGTAAGTFAISDVDRWVGATQLNGTLFFSDGGFGLWKTDGTAAGTMLVKRLDVESLITVGDTMFLAGYNDRGGARLWKSDGTSIGTVPVKDLGAVQGDGALFFVGGAGGRLLFINHRGSIGNDLWSSDGTADGTVLLRASGSPNYPDPHVAALGPAVLFHWSGELWKTDGTATGTALLAATSLVTYGTPFAIANGQVLFGGWEATTGAELWKSDGTRQGTVQLANLVPDTGTGTFSSYPSSLTERDGVVFFLADDGMHGSELWRSDGTPAGTAMVSDINPGTPSAFGPVAANASGMLVTVNGTLYFAADDGFSGPELWKSDGSEHGTMRVKDLNPGPGGCAFSRLTEVNGEIFFVADDGVSGAKLWKSDGTEQGTVPLAHVDPVSYFSPPADIVAAGGMAFFLSGRALWKSDGSAVGTVRVKDFDVATDGSIGLSVVDGTLFVLTSSSLRRLEIWTSDGSAGTVLVTSSAGVYAADHLTPLNGLLFFVAHNVGPFDSAPPNELWRTDGTASGTTALSPIDVDWNSPAVLPSFDGAVYFTAYGVVPGAALFRSDGTATGTTPLKMTVPRSGLTDVGGRFLFRACAQTSDDCGVWESDGTPARTRRLASGPFIDLQPTWPPLTVAGTFAFFAAADGDGDVELWALPLSSVGQCGNGVPDVGEACDDGGESAQCGADCLPPTCGDGIVNGAAGETCDDGPFRSGCCAWTCTPEPEMVGSPCVAGDVCNGSGSCNAAGQCQLGEPLQCDDHDDRTTDRCDPRNGCVHSGIPSCRGDCNGDDTVTIDELTVLVNVALGQASAAACAAGDANRDGRTTVDELIVATRSALGGCPLLDDLG